jgi:hypothetical protein
MPDPDKQPPVPGRVPTGWAVAGGVIITIGLLALWAAVHDINRPFDVNHPSQIGTYEKIAAKANHDAIVAVGYLCDSERDETGKAIRVSDYLLTMAADNDADQLTNNAKSSPPMSLQPPSYILAAIVLSHHIGWARIALAEEVRWSYIAVQIFQWSIVVIGAITTVLISIKAMSNDQWRFYIAVGIAAIIFSTLGTAIATMNSFYAPRVTHDHDEHSLRALQTLHLQLATGITREDHVCDPPTRSWTNDWRFKRIKAIAEQYAAVMSSAPDPQNNTPDGEPDDAPQNDHSSHDGTMAARLR